LAREFGADIIYGQIIAIVDSSRNRGFGASLAIMKNWWPKNKSKENKERERLIRVIRLLNLYLATQPENRALENDAKQ
jgi:hypothetical protein